MNQNSGSLLISTPPVSENPATPPLHWQRRLGDAFGQADLEGVDVEGEAGVVAHQGGQLHQAAGAELGHGGGEGGFADPVGAKELAPVV